MSFDDLKPVLNQPVFNFGAEPTKKVEEPLGAQTGSHKSTVSGIFGSPNQII